MSMMGGDHQPGNGEGGVCVWVSRVGLELEIPLPQGHVSLMGDLMHIGRH